MRLTAITDAVWENLQRRLDVGAHKATPANRKTAIMPYGKGPTRDRDGQRGFANGPPSQNVAGRRRTNRSKLAHQYPRLNDLVSCRDQGDMVLKDEEVKAARR